MNFKLRYFVILFLLNFIPKKKYFYFHWKEYETLCFKKTNFKKPTQILFLGKARSFICNLKSPWWLKLKELMLIIPAEAFHGKEWQAEWLRRSHVSPGSVCFGASGYWVTFQGLLIKYSLNLQCFCIPGELLLNVYMAPPLRGRHLFGITASLHVEHF